MSQYHLWKCDICPEKKENEYGCIPPDGWFTISKQGSYSKSQITLCPGCGKIMNDFISLVRKVKKNE